MTNEKPKNPQPTSQPTMDQLIEAAAVGLKEQRKKLKAQEASIPESLERTMQACELALTASRTALALAHTQLSCLEAIMAYIKDSGRLSEAASKRLEVLYKI